MFSGARNTLPGQRSSLKSEAIERLEYLKSWFRLVILTEEYLHAIVRTLHEDGATEALEEVLDYKDGQSTWGQTV